MSLKKIPTNFADESTNQKSNSSLWVNYKRRDKVSLAHHIKNDKTIVFLLINDFRAVSAKLKIKKISLSTIIFRGVAVCVGTSVYLVT